MLGILGSLLPGLLHLGDKLIIDKDKQAEYAFKVLQMSQDLALKLLDTKTYPWVDALVKLAYASTQIVKGLLRPVGSAIGTGYCLLHPEIIHQLHNMGPVGDAVLVALFGSFPGWMASRHQEKKRAAKTGVDPADFPDSGY